MINIFSRGCSRAELERDDASKGKENAKLEDKVSKFESSIQTKEVRDMQSTCSISRVPIGLLAGQPQTAVIRVQMNAFMLSCTTLLVAAWQSEQDRMRGVLQPLLCNSPLQQHSGWPY